VILLSGFIGAFLGSLASLIFSIWKFHRDERSSRCDELCQAVIDVANAASNYWAKTFSSKQMEEQIVLEARIRGLQSLVDGLYADFRGVIRSADTNELDDIFSDLVDALTGGHFSVGGRSRDALRAMAAPQMASAAIVAIRRAHRNTIPFAGVVRDFHENKRRTLDQRTWPEAWPRE